MSTLTCTLIQTALHWEDKAANLRMFDDKINSITERTEVIILPEMFNTGFSMRPVQFAEKMTGETVQWMKQVSKEKNVILTGSLMVEENGNYYNRLIWMLPNGTMGKYDKRHLFAYANEHEHYTAGNRRLIASVKGWKINLNICYDLRFPVWSRQGRREKDEKTMEYDMLVYVANWPERRSHGWKTLLQARAIENQSFCIGVNRVGNDGKDIYHSGDSMVINPLGEVLYTKSHDEDIFTITLQKAEVESIREKMPFWKDADPFMIIHDEGQEQ
ncbi:amidohydrolase [Aridibaculum aurantiacum]|uniref:amidohydrolase n=1 Tax=Aridibaculum aurantiacum TaxID=2810307 RepID=UPI001A96B700|nr:amidohydrolase [Aridibaculum aurantiacum]